VFFKINLNLIFKQFKVILEIFDTIVKYLDKNWPRKIQSFCYSRKETGIILNLHFYILLYTLHGIIFFAFILA